MRRKLCNLPLFLCTLAVQLVIRLVVWALPYRVWRRLLIPRGLAAWRVRWWAPDVSPSRCAWAVAASARFVPRSTCLVRALTAKLLLSWCGYPSQVCIGVSRESEFRSHAWLEYQGEVLVGSFGAGEYTPLPIEASR
jgi:hypothetical protein